MVGHQRLHVIGYGILVPSVSSLIEFALRYGLDIFGADCVQGVKCFEVEAVAHNLDQRAESVSLVIGRISGPSARSSIINVVCESLQTVEFADSYDVVRLKFYFKFV